MFAKLGDASMNKAFKNIKLVVQMNDIVGLLWNLG